MNPIASLPRLHIQVFIAILLTLTLATSSASAQTSNPLLGTQWHVSDDHANALTDRDLTLPISELLANDYTSADGASDFEIGEVVALELISGPSSGTAQILAKTLIYSPDRQSTGGIARIRYRVWADGVNEGEATLVIYLAPPVVPIAGRWQTATCNAQSCPASTDLGHGAEIGFFHSESGQFVLCDWVIDELVDCRLVNKDTYRIAPGRRPLVGDWNGDGWDDLAIHDPSTGDLVLVDPQFAGGSLDTGTFGSGSLDTFTADDTLTVGEPGLLINGDWFTAGFDLLGLFRPTHGDFLVETPAQDYQQVPFGSTSKPLEPLSGNWDRNSIDQLSTWDHDSREIHYLRDDFSIDPGATWQPIDFATGQPIAGIPFTLRLDRNSPRDVIGFYDPAADTLLLTSIPTADCRRHPDDPDCGTLPMQIPVDPGGGGSTTGGSGGDATGGDGTPGDPGLGHPADSK